MVNKEFWGDCFVFIIGGIGLLGSWMVVELVNFGVKVIGLV